jgi:hypothetical protein
MPPLRYRFLDAGKGGIRVKNLTRRVLVENAVAGKAFQSGIRTAEVIECGPRRHLVGLAGRAESSWKEFRQDETQGKCPSILLADRFDFLDRRAFFVPAMDGWKSWKEMRVACEARGCARNDAAPKT